MLQPVSSTMNCCDFSDKHVRSTTLNVSLKIFSSEDFQYPEMALLKLLSDNTRQVLDEFVLSMELWDLLEKEHYPITPYNDYMNWDICGDGEPDIALWKQNSYFAYMCAVMTMGNTLGLHLERWHPPTPEQQVKLTSYETVNTRVVGQCFVAFLELHRPEINNHAFGAAPHCLVQWREDNDNEALWDLTNVVGWKRDAIESALMMAELRTL